MESNTPLRQANEFANSAEEYFEKGDYSNACAAHFKAAELFLLAMNETKDSEAVKTLKLLYASHTRSGKELQRRINSPSLQRAKSKSSGSSEKAHIPPNKVVHLYSNLSDGGISAPVTDDDLGSQALFVGQSVNSKVLGKQDDLNTRPELSSIAQSYMILDKNQDIFRHENEEDPFNKFWDAVEGLVQKTSGPVAFTTAPIGKNDSENKSEPEISPNPAAQSTFLQSYMVIPPLKSDPQHSEVFKVSSNSKTLEEYEIENRQLKLTVDMLAKRVADLERAQRENNMLRSSIMQLREDYQKQRSILSSTDRSPRSANKMQGTQALSFASNPSVLKGSDSEILSQRIKYLESELERANEQNAIHVRKWEKLKETARKKREMKSSTNDLRVTVHDTSATEQKPPSASSPTPSQSMYYSVNSRFQ